MEKTLSKSWPSYVQLHDTTNEYEFCLQSAIDEN